MRILSENINGQVLKTNNKGYSSNREYKRISKFLKDNNISFDFDRSADFSSFYLDFVVNDIWLNIRVSDHTKRDYDLNKTISENHKTFENIKNKEYYAGNLQILNSEMFKEVFEVLKSIN